MKFQPYQTQTQLTQENEKHLEISHLLEFVLIRSSLYFGSSIEIFFPDFILHTSRLVASMIANIHREVLIQLSQLFDSYGINDPMLLSSFWSLFWKD
jgi:hypothetical protein